jgi:hypothetical protein
MAQDLHMALGYWDCPTLEFQGHDSWADWWSELLDDVRKDQELLDQYEG